MNWGGKSGMGSIEGKNSNDVDTVFTHNILKEF